MGFPQTREYELLLVLKGDPEFRELREYLDSYIKSVLDKFEMSQTIYDELYWQLTTDIKTAAKRFLHHGGEQKSYKFSTYFSWYLAERLNKNINIKRKTGH